MKTLQCEIGLYPIVDSSDWLEKLLPLGVKCIQLRMKDVREDILEEEITRSVLLAKKYNAILFVNDYWELAIRLGADGVHLGQEDLQYADVEKIYRAGLYLGISTHNEDEVEIACRFNPSYIACGPIYPTTSKIMPHSPQGVEKLKQLCKTLSCPVVAIGGIDLERLPDVLEADVSGVALISAITKADDPCDATKQFLRVLDAV